jgi:hypothetical protein
MMSTTQIQQPTYKLIDTRPIQWGKKKNINKRKASRNKEKKKATGWGKSYAFGAAP